MIAPTTVLKTRSDVRYRVVGGQGVLIRQEVGEVLVLNQVGARALELLETGMPVGSALERMAEEFEVEHAVLERDVRTFIEQLIESAVVEEVAVR